MLRLTRRQTLVIGGLAVAAALAGFAFRPTVYRVDTTRVSAGPLRVTVDENGVTRVRRHTEVAAPVSGRLAESLVEAGDSVSRGAVVARLYPAPLDPRTREQASAALQAAGSLRREAAARVAQARVTLAESQRARRRAEALASSGAIAQRDLEQATDAERLRQRDLEAALAHERAAAQDERAARGALVGADPRREGRAPVEVRAPMSGRVLRLFEEHDRVLPAGTPLLEIGDPRSLELVVDILTNDACAIEPGDRVIVRAGGREIGARVSRVEPSAFTKVSPLGIEEQRVNIIARLDSAAPWLGDRYEVDASIVLWEGAKVLKIPSGALVPVDSAWGVFTVRGGRARLQRVTLGHRGTGETEILAGLKEGALVVLHPDERLRDGVRVRRRGE